MTRTIDLNADVGEGIGDDAALLDVVTSASVACGYHAGDTETMLRTLVSAAARGVGAGAHPGFDDRDGFGRREIALDDAALETLVATQIRALADLATKAGTRLRHVKPHGAMYNMAARDLATAMAIGRAIRAIDPRLFYVGQSGSAMADAAARLGLSFAREAFPDRGYGDDGRLLPRTAPGAMITDPTLAAARAVRMACDGAVVTASGRTLPLGVDTLCIHGDTPGAVAIARAIRAALEAAGIAVGPLLGAVTR